MKHFNMEPAASFLATVVVLSVSTTAVKSSVVRRNDQPSTYFYPYGPTAGDKALLRKDSACEENIKIDEGFPFFGTKQTALSVNTDGVITFDTCLDDPTPTKLPLDSQPMIAIFWSDVDTSYKKDAQVFYRHTTDNTILKRASNDVKQNFQSCELDSFEAKSLLIVTWYGVPSYGSKMDNPVKLNTYQCVLVTDGTHSFAMYHYGKMEWTSAKNSTPAQIGFNKGDGKNYYVMDLASTLNSINRNSENRWIFRVDETNIMQPEDQKRASKGCPVMSKGLAVCTLQGDVHCRTFDLALFDYQGVCKFNMVSVDQASSIFNDDFLNFRVNAKNEFRYGVTTVSFTQSVELVYNGNTVQLIRNPSSQVLGRPIVKVNQHLTVLPLKTDNYTVDYSGTVVRIETKSGVVVEFDGYVTINVYVPKATYAGNLTGLCGNANGDSMDDFTTSDGTDLYGQPGAGRLIGDSYRIEDPEVTDVANCPAPESPTPCAIMPERYAVVCDPMADENGDFAECVRKIGQPTAETWKRNCLVDACQTNGDTLCQSVKAFVDECTHQQVFIPCSVWQQVSNCGPETMKCPAGTTYQCNVLPCLSNCANPLVPTAITCNQPMRDACVCSAGQKLSYDGQCVDDCPKGCFDEDMNFHKIAESWNGPDCITYTCVACASCKTGGQIQQATCPANQVCDGRKCSDVVKCTAWGDVHYYTFDGLQIDYQGVCKLRMLSLCENSSVVEDPLRNIDVFGRNDNRLGTPLVSFTFYAEVLYNGDTVRITRDPTSKAVVPVVVEVNQRPVVLPFKGPSYDIIYLGRVVRMSTVYGVSVEFDGDMLIVISIPKTTYAGQVTGICGNADGQIANDWRTNDLEPSFDPKKIGDSYVVEDPEVSDNSKCPAPATGRPNCNEIHEHDKVCRLLTYNEGIFAKCIKAIGQGEANMLRNSCLLDACMTNGETLCNSVKMLVDICSRLGHPVSCEDWQTASKCGAEKMKCPDGFVYKCSAAPCLASCSNPGAPRTCDQPPREACVCPDGQLLSYDGKCVTVCPKGCFDVNLKLREVGESWKEVKDHRCTKLTCVECAECDYGAKTNATECTDEDNDKNECGKPESKNAE